MPFLQASLYKFNNGWLVKFSVKAKIYFATGAMETPANGSKNDMVGLQNTFVAKLRSRNFPSLEVKDDIIEGAYHETTFPIGFTKGALWLYGMSSPKP